MDMRNERMAGRELEGLRVLALPSSGVAPEKHYIFHPLLAAKARWNWHIDLLCGPKPPKEYQELVAPSGRFFVRPLMIERQPWEDDPEAVAKADQLIKEIEVATGIPTGQVVLAADSKIGRGFVAPVINLGRNNTSRRVEADNLEPYRAVRRLFRFADDMLETSAPDLVYSYEWAKPWLFTVWLAAQRRGIPCVVVRRSKLRSDHCYVTADRLMFNLAARGVAAAKREIKAPVSEAAHQYIRAFREQPRMVNYVQAKWQEKAKNTWLHWHLGWARSTASTIVKSAARPANIWRVAKAARKLVDFNRKAARSWRQGRLLRTFSPGELAAMNYIYFPLHKETDLPVNFQAAAWFDQRNTIRLLASVVPNGYRLLVREHRHNYGLRPSRYYRELAQLPNVVLVDAYDSQFKYVENAGLIVTENGSTGWEGLLLGRRVLTLAQTFFDGAGRALKFEKVDDLGAVVVQALARPAVSGQASHDRDLGCMVDAEYETTFDPLERKAALDYLQAAIRPLLTGRAGQVSGLDKLAAKA